MSAQEENTTFQLDAGEVHWKMHFRSSPAKVHQAIATDEGRATYWAESAVETDGAIHFVFPGGDACDGKIIEKTPDTRFATEYFGSTVVFELTPDSQGRTDLQLSCSQIPERDRMEVTAGWVSVLLAMKAAGDFNVDLRNHDPDRTWWHGYADN